MFKYNTLQGANTTTRLLGLELFEAPVQFRFIDTTHKMRCEHVILIQQFNIETMLVEKENKKSRHRKKNDEPDLQPNSFISKKQLKKLVKFTGMNSQPSERLLMPGLCVLYVVASAAAANRQMENGRKFINSKPSTELAKHHLIIM